MVPTENNPYLIDLTFIQHKVNHLDVNNSVGFITSQYFATTASV